MAERRTLDIPVLVVGMGPVGLMTGLLLDRQGIASLVIDRYPTRLGAPKAHAVNPRSLEICRAAGVDMADLARRSTRPDEGRFVRFVTRLDGVEVGRLHYERQDDDALVATPTPLINTAQPAFEDVLLDTIGGSSRCATRRGWRWIDHVQDADGVTSNIEDVESGELIEVRSRYLVAADGAGSAVRESLGIAMEGPQHAQPRLMIHFKADLRAALADRPAIIYWSLDPASQGGLIAYDLGGNFAYMHRYDPATETLADFPPERCAAIVRGVMGTLATDIEILQTGGWSIAVQVAERYRDRRVFLAGDAAHRFPPAAGLGLNTGVQDAHNLAWKLAFALGGDGGEALLDSYGAERKRIARINADHSAANNEDMARLFALVRELAVDGSDALAARAAEPEHRATFAGIVARLQRTFDSFGLQLGFTYGPDETWTHEVATYTPSTEPGARMPHAWVTRDGQRVSTLDLLDPAGFTLVAMGLGDWAATAAELGVRLTTEGRDFADTDGNWLRVANPTGVGALLVRPDGHVLFRAERDDEATRAAMTQTLAHHLDKPAERFHPASAGALSLA